MEAVVIRFIDLGRQIGLDDQWPREFAFYDTVTDTFVNFKGSETWETVDDFRYDFDPLMGWELSRFIDKIPAGWPQGALWRKK